MDTALFCNVKGIELVNRQTDIHSNTVLTLISLIFSYYKQFVLLIDILLTFLISSSESLVRASSVAEADIPRFDLVLDGED